MLATRSDSTCSAEVEKFHHLCCRRDVQCFLVVQTLLSNRQLDKAGTHAALLAAYELSSDQRQICPACQATSDHGHSGANKQEQENMSCTAVACSESAIAQWRGTSATSTERTCTHWLTIDFDLTSVNAINVTQHLFTDTDVQADKIRSSVPESLASSIST